MRKRSRFLVGEQEPMVPIIHLPPIRLEGHFDVSVYNTDTDTVRRYTTQNLIMDYTLDVIGRDPDTGAAGKSIDKLFHTMSIGHNTDTPDPSDGFVHDYEISLWSENDGGIAEVLSQNTDPEYGLRRITRVFPPVRQATLFYDIGFFDKRPSLSPIYTCRALFKDPLGNVTPFSVFPNEFVIATYELRMFAPTLDTYGTVQFGPPGSASIDYTLRPQNVGDTVGWLDLLHHLGDWNIPCYIHETAQLVPRLGNNFPTPNDLQTSSSLLTYVSASYGVFYRDTEHFWTFSDGNFDTGVGLFTWTSWYQSGNAMLWQLHLSGSINKTNNNRMHFKLRQYWGRN